MQLLIVLISLWVGPPLELMFVVFLSTTTVVQSVLRNTFWSVLNAFADIFRITTVCTGHLALDTHNILSIISEVDTLQQPKLE